MEYATSGEFVLQCISVESYFFYYKMFRKSLVSLVTFLWNFEQYFALQNPGPDCTYVKH